MMVTTFGSLSALADAVWGSKSQTTSEFWGVWILDDQRSSTLGSLHRTDVRAPSWPRHVPRGQASGCGIDLEADAGEVCVGGDRGGFQVVLQYRTVLWWLGGGD